LTASTGVTMEATSIFITLSCCAKQGWEAQKADRRIANKTMAGLNHPILTLDYFNIISNFSKMGV